MANEGLKPVAGLLLVLNLCMYVIVAAVGGWAINHAINYGFFIGSGLQLPAHFSPIYFPIGNAATGFFVIFAVIAGVVGAAAALAGFHHVRAWSSESLPAAASSGFIAWTLTLLAMGYVRTSCSYDDATGPFVSKDTITNLLLWATCFFFLQIGRQGD